MESATDNFGQLGSSSQHFARRLLTISAKHLAFWSSAAVLVAGLAAFRRGKFAPTDPKPSWLQTVLKGAGLISTLWLAFRSQGRHQEDK